MSRPLFCALLIASGCGASAQDLLSLLGEDSTTVEYTTASFKTTRVINSHSLENTAHGVLDFKINHRFGELSSGADNAYGLDGPATIRLGLDYGVTDRIAVGIGRSNDQKTADGFVKYKVLRQCDQGCRMPVTLGIVAAMGVNTQRETDLPWYDPTRTNYYSHRLSYSFQAIVGRKFNEYFTMQLMPGVVHRNLVATTGDPNDLMNVGVAARYKITRRLALNGEYFYVPPGQGPRDGYHNSVSGGLDIETGGHVFQLHFTNSPGMFERSYIAETTGDFFNGDIRFGFNVSRVFTLHDAKKKARLKQEQGKAAN